jgi:hypothetical protein
MLAIAAAASSAFAASSEVWKWVDDQGVTHYSDQPVPGATRIEVRTGNVADAPATSASSAAAPASDDATVRYRNFEIWRPEDNQSIINTGGQVGVEIRIEPEVQPSHTLSLYLDGRLVTGFPRNAMSYALTEVPRGLHNVTAVVSDRSGKTLQETDPVIFTVRQESIAQPPVGPALKPPPKPQPRGAANKLPATQPSYGALNGGRPAIDPATNMPVNAKPKPKPGKP